MVKLMTGADRVEDKGGSSHSEGTNKPYKYPVKSSIMDNIKAYGKIYIVRNSVFDKVRGVMVVRIGSPSVNLSNPYKKFILPIVTLLENNKIYMFMGYSPILAGRGN